MQALLPELAPDAVRAVGASGLYEIELDGRYAYVTADGRYLISGDLIDLQTGEELTEQHRRAWRLQQVESVAAQAIQYAATSPPLATVTVFTDVDCTYCRRWHQQVPELNRQGITVRYLFFPRAGPGSASFRKAEQVWCARDQNAALTAAKRDRKVSGVLPECVAPVSSQYQLATRFGVRATPALLMPDGTLTYGYRDVASLLQELAAMGIQRAPE